MGFCLCKECGAQHNTTHRQCCKYTNRSVNAIFGSQTDGDDDDDDDDDDSALKFLASPTATTTTTTTRREQ